MPRWIVENVSVWWLAAIALICIPLLAVALQALIRHRSPDLIGGHQNEAVGYLGATVAVVYAIIVRFMVITLWDQYTSAGDTVQAGTSDLPDLVQFSRAIGPSAQGRVQGQETAYAESVATSEWRAMARGEGSPAAQQDFDRLIGTVQRLKVRGQQRLDLAGRTYRECCGSSSSCPA